jgi:protein-tyrosine phosphatase
VGRHRRQEEHIGFRLLYVCTGNICRSPFAEILTRHLLVGRLGGRAAAGFHVSSAGVTAVVGSGMYPDSRDQLAPWRLDGVAAERFTARQLRSAMIAESDLVLGASTRHRSAVVDRNHAGLPITFSILEFARLARAVDPAELPQEPVARAHALVEAARMQRGLVPPDGSDSVADPMGRSLRAHQEAAAQIREAVQAIVDVIAPVGMGSGPLPVVPPADGNGRR